MNHTDPSSTPISRIGLVVIGRNEGERLRRCLASATGTGVHAVYVDSGSTDGSPQVARAMGAEVVELRTDVPFTAARARNAGAEHLLACRPELEYLQFVDGDCEMDANWLATASAALDAAPDLVVVCGRRRERFPQASIYNRLCDMEWDTPVGDAGACGGDAMFRVSAFRAAGGYNPDLIAGEEPELCVRLRLAGGRIRRLDAEMTLHDAAMTRFGQWWRRNIRNGHAYAEGAALHGKGPVRHWAREARSNFIWGLLLPAVAVAAAWPTRGVSLLLLPVYPLLGYRVWRYARRRRGWPAADAGTYAVFCVLCKFPQVFGQCVYWMRRLQGSKPRLIEYKLGDAVVPQGT